MATIVREARDPWWANLAVNVLGGLWNDYQQREQNKKLNALQGEIASAINGLAGGQDNGGGGLMTNAGSNIGASIGGNAWENAFHQSDNPLADYDAATSGISPTAQGLAQATAQATPIQAAPVQAITTRQPTSQDILKAFAGLMSSKRFGGVNPKAAQELLTPYLTLNEQARAEQRRKELAESYVGAGDDVSKLSELYRGAIEGYVPQSILTSGQGRYQYDNPYQQAYTQNTGGTTRYGSFNPRTGQYTEAGSYENDLTPAQRVAMAQHEATLAEQRRQYEDTMRYNREGREFEQEKWRAEQEEKTRPKFTSVVTGNDGRLYQVDQYGNRRLFDPDSVGLSDTDKARIKFNGDRITALTRDYNTLLTERANLLKTQQGGTAEAYKTEGEEPANPQLKAIDDRLEEIRNEIRGYEDEINGLLRGKASGQGSSVQTQGHAGSENFKLGAGTSVASNMVSHADNGKVSSAFGAVRPGGRKHMGVDVAVKQGTPILVPDIGAPMTVKSVGTNPHHSYGNHVVLSGEITDRDGKHHTIEMVVAHMDNGSLNVKRGQKVYAGSLIGKVGNTGNTSDRSKLDKNGNPTITNWYEGKNSGYHLHLETKIDGEHVDPEKFNELIYPYIMYEQPKDKKYVGGTNMQTAQSGNTSESNDDEVIWRNPQTGKTITRREDADLRRRADNGELKYLGGSKAADSYYMEHGYERVGGGTSQPSSGDITVAQNSPASIDVRPISPDMTILGSEDIVAVSPDVTPTWSGDVAASPDVTPAPTYAEAVNHATSADIQQGLASLNGEITSPDYVLGEGGNPFWSLANMRGEPWGYALDGRIPYKFSLLGS